MPSSDTRGLICQGFKRLMAKKQFDKITVTDISEECGINRQTFYYHFHDKYELLNMIFYNEVISELVDGLSVYNWYAKFLEMLKKIKNNSKFYRNALNISYGGEFRNYLLDVSTKLFYDTVETLSGNQPIDDKERSFISKFFAYGVSGMIIDWVTSGMKESPECITSHLKEIIEDGWIAFITNYMKS